MITLIKYIFYLLTLSAINIVFSNAETCVLPYKHFPMTESLALKNNQLIVPEGDHVTVDGGKTLTFFCPGYNYLMITNKNSVEATCIEGENFHVGTTNYKLENFGCKSNFTGDILPNGSQCKINRGVYKDIGYNFNGNFLTLITVCYDNANANTLYVQHKLYGSSVEYSKNPKSRLNFRQDGTIFGKDVPLGNYFKLAKQQVIFKDLLGSVELANKYIYGNSYLNKGHLAPFSDEVFLTSKSSTQFYLNTLPQWKSINEGNWNIMEDYIRNLAIFLKETFVITTGSHEILQLENKNGKYVDINLVNDKLPVPKFIWKVVYSEKSKNAIAFVNLNNPHVQTVTAEDYLCTNICQENDWKYNPWSDHKKGLLYCCDVNTLKQKIPNIPDINYVGILKCSANICKSN